jgi:metal-responsive CopG/Arc/MetJ family transcriptional regulator
MRVTVHIKEALNQEIKRLAANEHKSVSLLISESVEFYIKERKRRELGNRVLGLVGKTKVSAHALRHLNEGRREHDRS